MKKVYLVIPIFLFLIFFLSPSFAIAVDINRTGQLLALNCFDIDCFDDSGDIYCAIACGEGSGQGKIFKFNATLLNKETCDPSAFFSSPNALAWININQIDISKQASNVLYRVNVTTFGSCSPYNSSNPVIPYGSFGMDYYNGGGNSWLYVAEDGHLVDEATGTHITTMSYSDRFDVSLPNSSSNATIWVTDGAVENFNMIRRATNGALDGTKFYINNTYGISSLMAFSIVRVDASTEWLFLLQRGYDSSHWNIYKANLTEGLETDVTTFSGYNVEAGSEIEDGDFCLEFRLSTELNGTLYWWLNTTNVYNHTITTAPLIEETYQYCLELENGGYYVWHLWYEDSLSNFWVSDVINFLASDSTYKIDLTVIPAGLGALLGLDADQSNLLLSLIVSLLVAVAVILKVKGDTNIFAVVFLGMFVVMWGMGFVPLYVMILLVFMVAVVIVYKLKGG